MPAIVDSASRPDKYMLTEERHLYLTNLSMGPLYEPDSTSQSNDSDYLADEISRAAAMKIA